jgi:hypothetical protein
MVAKKTKRKGAATAKAKTTRRVKETAGGMNVSAGFKKQLNTAATSIKKLQDAIA